MYSIVESVLKRGGYDLTEIVRKIDTMWVEGKLTDEEYNALLELARNGADSQNSLNIINKLNELEGRVRALEGETDTEEYPEYISGKWYYNGDKCSYEGINYTCTAPEGTACVWSPKDYPAYWQEV